MRYTGVLSVVFVSLFASGYAAPMFRQQNQQAPQPVNTDPQSNPQPENNAPQPGTRGGPRIPKAPNPFPALREGNHVNGHGEDYRWRLPGTPKNGDGLLKQPQPQDVSDGDSGPCVPSAIENRRRLTITDSW